MCFCFGIGYLFAYDIYYVNVAYLFGYRGLAS